MEGDDLDELFGDEQDNMVMERAMQTEGEEQRPDMFDEEDVATEEIRSAGESMEDEVVEGRRRAKTLSDVKIKEVKLKRLVAPRDRAMNPMLTKLPGFMGIVEDEFSQNKVMEELNEFEDRATLMAQGDENSVQSQTYLRAATSIRWRKDPLTKKIQTNARLVKWSDGSVTMMIGEDHFELGMPSTMAEYSYIYGKHPEQGFMECLGRLTEKVTIRPFIDITGQGHRKYLATAAETSSKAHSDVRVKMAVTMVDPEKEKQRMIKLEQEKIKAKRKQDAKQRHLKQRSFDRVSRMGLSARFLEERDGDEGMELDEDGEEINQDEYEDDFIDDTGLDDAAVSEQEEGAESPESASESEAEFSNQENSSDAEVGIREKASTTRAPRRTAIIDDDDEPSQA